jgi:hypothetical protein
MKDEHKERTTRLLNSLKTRAEADRKTIASQDAEAQKAATGDLSVTVGEAHFGLGEFAPSVASITAGLQKGQVKHLAEAYVYLGRSQAAQKNFTDAKKAFSQLKSVPNISPRVLKLWELYSDKLG